MTACRRAGSDGYGSHRRAGRAHRDDPHSRRIDRNGDRRQPVNRPVERLAYRPGEVLRSDPDNQGDADDPTATTNRGDLALQGLFARRAMDVLNAGALFGTIENCGTENDTLIAVAAPGVERIWLHDPLSPQPVSLPLEIAPGKPLVLEPGRLHLMVGGLMHGRSEGSDVTIGLRFRRADQRVPDHTALML
jgi:copper(I)-binding protein